MAIDICTRIRKDVGPSRVSWDGGGIQPPAAKMCLRNSWYRGSVASPNGGSCRSGAASLTAAQSAGVSSLAAFFFLEGA